MRCPFCGTDDTQVKDSRGSDDGASIRRRRLCSSCGSRFTTFERIQLRELIVVKRNGKKSIFDREKIVKSMEIALRKRKVDNDVVERAQNGIVRQLESSGEAEIQSDLIGELVMNALGQIDHVAYIRYASVYRNFREASDEDNWPFKSVNYSLKKYFMKQAFLEAYRALGQTGKNPNVGCVLVKNNFIIARARTSPGGRPHAEENLLSQLSKAKLQGSSLFVTLEPCAHRGKNGTSCANLISNSGIKEVFISNYDPDSRTAGKGIEILRKSKINVFPDFLVNEGIDLNKGYLANNLSNRPFVTIKLAISLDGKIALKNKNSKWISNELSRNFGHMMRANSDGVLTTNSTIEKDNSRLTCRLNGLEKYSPLKIVVDRGLKLNQDYSIFNNSKKENLLIYHCSKNQSKIKNYPKNTNLVYIDKNKNFLELMLNDLANRKIKNLLIESGTAFCSEIIKANLVDQIAFFRSNKIIGNDGLPFVNNLSLNKISDSLSMKIVDFKFFDSDIYELRRFI